MRVTWIVPDTYGFLVDELKELSRSVAEIRVLSSEPAEPSVLEGLPGVDFHHCREKSLIRARFPNGGAKKLRRLHSFRRLLGSRWHIRKIVGIYEVLHRLESERPSHIVHSHFAHPGGLGGTLFPNVAQVLTLRGYDILTTGNYGSLWNPFYRNNLIDAFKSGIPVTCGSHYSAHRARQILGSEADIRHLPEGLPAFDFKSLGRHSRSSLGIQPDAVVLMSAGNLVGVKNPALLLRSFAGLLEQQEIPLVLLICGDGPLKARLEMEARSLGIENQVKFLGRLPREELSDIFELADIFTHTSMSEGFGNVIPEAMLHRLLVVASPVGVAPELIRHGENGYLPELGDLSSWVHWLGVAVGRVGAFQGQAEENYNLVIKRHSMERRIEGFLGIYEEVLRTRSKAKLQLK